jgi:hypothetical protein
MNREFLIRYKVFDRVIVVDKHCQSDFQTYLTGGNWNENKKTQPISKRFSSVKLKTERKFQPTRLHLTDNCLLLIVD